MNGPSHYNVAMRPGNVALAITSTLMVGAGFGGQGTADKETISKQAVAILQANCIRCHDSSRKTAGIDLSTRALSISTTALNDRDLAKSRLIQQVASGQMPPTGRLSDANIDILREWISHGASYPVEKLIAINPAMMPLWSFQPVQPQVIRQTPFDKLARNPIDHFVFEKLASSGLHPSQPADKLTLLRRVTVDLTGLPPTTQEIDSFVKDQSPKAYEKVVDRLLASPAYGERWARHWLDVVRYGESDGYERNILRPNAWPYRDYVIRAFNQDLPFTRFITEQIAGDTIGKGDPNVEAATGFLVAGIHDTVGNATEEGTRQQRISDLEDITSTTCASFLAITVGCARCHDHKFDPIPQRDFYRLASSFAGVHFGERTIASGDVLSHTLFEKDKIARQALVAINSLNELDDSARHRVIPTPAIPGKARSAVNARRNVDSFAPVVARWVRFNVLATRDGSEPCLDELQVYGPDNQKDLALASNGAVASASSVYPGNEFHKINHLNDGRLGNEYSWISQTRGTGWAQIDLGKTQRISRVVWSRDGAEIARFDDRLPTAYRIEVSLDGKTWKTVSTEAGRSDRAGRDYVHPDALIKVMNLAERSRRVALQKALQDLTRKREALDAFGTAYAGQFTKPDPTFVLRRGDVMQRGEEVSPGALSQISSLPSNLCDAPDAPDTIRRQALASWISNDKNPLTARVIVNRIWQYHFGVGLVGTPSDFGRNGEKPSHPELLDWLANDFMTHGWRIKRLQKMIVLSYTFCQSGAADSNGLKLDAGNRLLWRMPLHRMEAESIRDAILATSGKLDRRMGGPGFRLFKYSEVNVAIYDPLDQYGPDTWRRSIYRVSARSIRDDLLENFDCPENAQRAPKREMTTTALQALSLLNGKFLVDQAHYFANRVRSEAGPKLEAQTARAFQLAFGRVPRPAEVKTATNVARKLGMPSFCRALMNANEFLYY